MNNEKNQIYIIGYGNRFRQDDGMGPEIIEMLRADEIPGVVVEDKFQLSVDDAYDIAAADASVVLFIDASFYGEEPFTFDIIRPLGDINFSLPLISPEYVISLCSSCFEKEVQAYIIGIRGCEWGFSERISCRGMENMLRAYDFTRELIEILHMKISLYECIL